MDFIINSQVIPKLGISALIKPRQTDGHTVQTDRQTLSKKLTPTFNYHVKQHQTKPHVIKFSGGKSSGLLLFTLLESGMLDAKRGDVVVFNNTSAEHPETYRFVASCKTIVEQKYGIPFFWVERCTYEDSRSGSYTRIPSFRLVNSQPHSQINPDGYSWKGEVFEELLSFTGFVPSLLQRTCTTAMKLGATRDFLKEWFASKEATERLGHHGNGPRMNDEELYERHLKSGGKVPKEIFISKKAYVNNRPIVRPSQQWAEFSSAWQPLDNAYLRGLTRGDYAFFGRGGINYLAFIGLRSDESRRTEKIHLRNTTQSDDPDYRGEYVYTPLEDMGVTKHTVEYFWKQQEWGLNIDPADNLSNCTLCFMKGVTNLRKAYQRLSLELTDEYRNTPSDINWWITVEKKYGRNMIAEGREVRSNIPDDFIGFFGAKSGFFYSALLNDDDDLESDYPNQGLPCECTE